MASDTDDLRFELTDRLATLTLNRPEKLNALSEAMITAGIEHLRRCAEDAEVGAVLVTGAGRAFCAGGDVSAMGSTAREALTFEQRVDRQRVGQELSRLLAELPKVTIAAVNGAAVGAGLGIALSCDLVFASDRARFGTAFAKVGFGGDYGTTWQLTRRAGPAKAKELFFLADLVSAEEAARLGLVNRVFPHDAFADEVGRIAARIAHGPLVSYRYMKENVNLSLTADFGLHNAVMPVGATFLEVVSPVREGTTAGRLLDRRGGDGGYMVILQTADLRADRTRLAALGVRIVWQVELDDIATVHLHPRDLGGAIVSLDQPVPPESWRWGGPKWQAKVRTDAVHSIASVTIQADDPPRMAARWAEVLGLPAPRRSEAASTLALSPGAIRFVPITDGRGEGVSAFGVAATDAGRALAAARARGLATAGRSVSIGGVRVE